MGIEKEAGRNHILRITLVLNALSLVFNGVMMAGSLHMREIYIGIIFMLLGLSNAMAIIVCCRSCK